MSMRGLGLAVVLCGAPAPAWCKAHPPVVLGAADKGNQVTINLATSPRVEARVTWGRKLLGTTPLVLKCPRDSGPIDVVIRAEGYVTLNTRLYTFADERLTARLTKDEDKKTLFGYKKELPPPVPAPVPGAVPGTPGAVPPPGAPGTAGAVPPPGAPGAAVIPGTPVAPPPAAPAPPPAPQKTP